MWQCVVFKRSPKQCNHALNQIKKENNNLGAEKIGTVGGDKLVCNDISKSEHY